MILGEVAVAVACLAAILTAWTLVRPWGPPAPGRVYTPAYRPIAILLSLNLASDLAGFVLRQGFLSAQQRPYVGLARLAYHVEQACFLVWPMGFVAVAVGVLARRKIWAILAAGLSPLLARIVVYPWLRGERRLGWLLLAEQVAVVTVGGWALWRLHRRGNLSQRARGLPRPDLMPQETAVLALLAAEATKLITFCGPLLLALARSKELRTGAIFEYYWLAQIAYVMAFAWLAFMQWRRWRWTSS